MHDAGALTRSILLVGAGGWGREVAQAISTSPRWHLAGLVDIAPKALEAARDALPPPLPACFNDAIAAAEALNPDAVAMVVPNPARQPLLEYFLRAGIPVFAEKPLVHTPSQLDQLAKTLFETSTPLMVAQNYRFSYQARALRTLIASGFMSETSTDEKHLGRLHEIRITFARNGRNFAGHPVSRMAGPTGLLMELGVHHFDLLRYLIGSEPIVVRAESASPLHEFAGWTSVETDLNFPRGITAHYSARYDAEHAETPWGGSWELTFDRGTVHYFPCPVAGEKSIRFTPASPFGWPQNLPQPDARAQRQTLLLAALEEFASSLDDNRPAETSFSDNRLTLELAFSIARAAGWS